jgi:hypothetical protein
MNQLSLSKWLKVIILCAGFVGLAIYFIVFPVYGKDIAKLYPEFSNAYWPWLIFIWVTAVPCYCVLFFSWKIACSIGNNHSFSIENANNLRRISYLAASDSLILFSGNVIFLLLNMNHPSVLLASLIIVFTGIAIAVTAAILSHFVANAVAIKEENDLTI